MSHASLLAGGALTLSVHDCGMVSDDTYDKKMTFSGDVEVGWTLRRADIVIPVMVQLRPVRHAALCCRS